MITDVYAQKRSFFARHRYIFIATISLFILAATGSAIFFLYPRAPTVEIGSLDVSKGLLVRIHNHNYYDITVKEVEGSVLFGEDNIASLSSEKFDVKARGTAEQIIPIKLGIFGRGPVLYCSQHSEFAAKMNLVFYLNMLGGSHKVKHSSTISLPCPEITEDEENDESGSDNESTFTMKSKFRISGDLVDLYNRAKDAIKRLPIEIKVNGKKW